MGMYVLVAVIHAQMCIMPAEQSMAVGDWGIKVLNQTIKVHAKPR